ncbi:hypothetical protein I4U23_016103 [Adineta vaga]|nr:hypothetical protein I4U23_016103 [Adineta vaga]
MNSTVQKQPSTSNLFSIEQENDNSIAEKQVSSRDNFPKGLRGGGACFDCLACLCFCCALEEIACFECLPAAFVAPLAIIPALSAVGFTSAGVAAGSIAASLQTATTASGSIFALCQSAGAVGAVAASTSVGVGLGAGAAAGGVTAAVYRKKNPKKKTDLGTQTGAVDEEFIEDNNTNAATSTDVDIEHVDDVTTVINNENDSNNSHDKETQTGHDN